MRDLSAPSSAPERSEDPVIARNQSIFNGRVGNILRGTVNVGVDALEFGAEATGHVAGGVVRGAWALVRGAVHRLMGRPFRKAA